MTTTKRLLICLSVLALLAVGLPLPTPPVYAQAITVDGNPLLFRSW